MNIHKFSQVLSFLESIRANAYTTNQSSTGIDATLYENNGLIALISVGAMTGTTPALEVRVQESIDNVTFTDVVDAKTGLVVTTGVQTASGFYTLEMPLRKATKRYLRVTGLLTGTTPNVTYSVTMCTQKGNVNGL